MVLAFGQLMPQLIAATHPMSVMNMVGAKQVIQLALGFEFIGVTHFSWLLAGTVKHCCGLNQKSVSDAHGNDASVRDNSGSACGNPNDSNHQHIPSLRPLLESWSNIRSRMDLDVNTLDATSLYESAERGLEATSSSDVHSRQIAAWLQAQSMSSGASNAKYTTTLYGFHRGHHLTSSSKDDSSDGLSTFPSPADIARHLISNELPVPRYLLPPHHDKHIPPHIVAYDLVRRHDEVTERLVGLQKTNAVEKMYASKAISILRKIHDESKHGDFPDIHDFFQQSLESGQVNNMEVVATLADTTIDTPSMSPALEPLLMKSTMSELTLSQEQKEAFAEYRQNYHNFRKGNYKGSEGPVLRVLAQREKNDCGMKSSNADDTNSVTNREKKE